jgi:thiamine-phosphate pyrophosphorylase
MPSRHHERLERVKLYLITDAAPRVRPMEKFLREAIAGGVGMVQLRDKSLSDARLLDVAVRCAIVCRDANVPFIVNDRIDIALACGADGVHLGQDDMPVRAARMLAGDQLIIGLSTHTPEQVDAAATLDADYIGVGPIHETPTKPGRVAVGPQLVAHAAQRQAQMFFAIGGLEPGNVAPVVQAGARGVSVLRWISQAEDPAAAARAMSEQIEDARRARSS